MKSSLLEEILSNVEHWRVEFLGYPPFMLEDILKKRLSVSKPTTIRVFGGFDSRIIYIVNSNTSEYYIISMSRPLVETIFYSIFHLDIELIDNFCGILIQESKFVKAISKQLKVGLISLAKQEVYTFPRFALGISDIAHALRNQYKSNVYLYDLQLIKQEDLIKILIDSDFDIIGVSMTFGLFDVMEHLVSELFAIFPSMKIVIGGSLAAIEYKEILNLFPNAIVSIGEGEKSMPQIIEWALGEKKLDDIPNIVYRNEHGKMIITKHELPKSIMSLPELDLLTDTIDAKGVFQLETSRGCYNACSFCPRQHKGYWRSVTKGIETLEYFLNGYVNLLKQHGVDLAAQTIYVVDEEFIGEECKSNRDRTESICALLYKYGIRFEVSFRMNAVFSSTSLDIEKEEKLCHIKTIHRYGLNRVLIGVESGIDSVLIRFNKNISSLENTQGIRLLTALGLPVRFTYITFDPLMSFDELVATYRYQGRTDLIMDPNCIDNVCSLLNIAVSDERWNNISLGEPFYHYIPYMLVSLECLIGSTYYNNLENNGLLEENTITSLGKRNAHYSDERIGKISEFSQLWVDHNFSLDYTLKSLGKIYPVGKSEKIRAVRTILKDNAYRLLGKFIYFFNQDFSILSDQSNTEIEFIKDLCKFYNNKGTTVLCDEAMFRILEFQRNILEANMVEVNQELTEILNKEDYCLYLNHYKNWKNNYRWQLIHKK